MNYKYELKYIKWDLIKIKINDKILFRLILLDEPENCEKNW